MKKTSLKKTLYYWWYKIETLKIIIQRQINIEI